MPGAYDGSIHIDTQLDNKGFSKGSAEVRKAIKSLTTEINKIGTTLTKAAGGNVSAMNKFQTQFSQAKSRAEELEQQLRVLGSTKVETEDPM